MTTSPTMSLEAQRSNLVPTLEIGSLDDEGGVLVEDSFFGVKPDLVVNPPGVVFAVNEEEDLFYSTELQEYSQQPTAPIPIPTSDSNSLSFTNSFTNPIFNNHFDFEDASSAITFTAPPVGWQEQNQDLWFLENLVQENNIDTAKATPQLEENFRESSPSKEEILEEIRMEAGELEAANRSPSPFASSVGSFGSASPGYESSIASPGLTNSDSHGSLASVETSAEISEIASEAGQENQEMIYVDGQPLLSIPADQIPEELLAQEVFLEISNTAGMGLKILPTKERPRLISPSEIGIKFNKDPPKAGNKKRAGRWRTSGIADAKERKKAQNREAAARYRLKKQQEKETVHQELEKEELKNMNLRKKVLDIENEIKYLKDLMQEIRAKNVQKV